MSNELINADFSRRVVIATDEMRWTPSPQPGVDRRPLDRMGGAVARATSVVRYAPASAFPAHEHALGEEFLVLSGVFSDEHGDYPAGTYVRNPPGSRHSPRTAPGCIILVKLRQMQPTERLRIVTDTTTAVWKQGDPPGTAQLLLYDDRDTGEKVTVERLEAGAHRLDTGCPGGEEIFILSGALQDEHGTYGAGSWIRNPAGFQRHLGSSDGAVYWAKRGHLLPMS
jgi:anti-sigma factor ChrR (cupin superfamily)